jgi:hypothetical protein
LGVLAAWLGFSGSEEYWADHARRMAETRSLVLKILGFAESSAATSTPVSG